MDFEKMASNTGLDLEDFIELTEMLVDVSTNDAAQYQKAVEEGDHYSASQSAHSIKGASANLGFTDIASAASTLESLAKNKDFNDYESYLTQINEQIKLIKERLDAN